MLKVGNYKAQRSLCETWKMRAASKELEPGFFDWSLHNARNRKMPSMR